MKDLGIRWTVGDVSLFGFEALRLSIAGAWNVFGPSARYVVCLNGTSPADARARVGDVPAPIAWRVASRDDLPRWLLEATDVHLAEGVLWKLAPLRLFGDRLELSLDNDCILWSLPDGLRRWLDEGGFAIAADVRPSFGQFTSWCGPAPMNSGIRGLPPAFDLEPALRRTLEASGVRVLRSELDEQGLQVATLLRESPLAVVDVDDVSICSPFPPHRPGLGRAGAHFVGLNTKSVPWSVEGRPGHELLRDHFRSHRLALYERVGLRAPG